MEIRKDASRPFLSPHCGDDDDDCIYILFFPSPFLYACVCLLWTGQQQLEMAPYTRPNEKWHRSAQ